MKYLVTTADKDIPATVDTSSGTIVLGGAVFECTNLPNGAVLVRDTHGSVYRCGVASSESDFGKNVFVENFLVPVSYIREAVHHARNILHINESEADSGRITVSAPMPGLVRKILVGVGDTIRKGTVLMILEAMKMENEVRAAHDCTVQSIDITEGSSVEKGRALVVLHC